MAKKQLISRKQVAAVLPVSAPSTLSFRERVDRLELLEQARALVDAGLSHMAQLGWGADDAHPAIIIRADGSQARLLPGAVDIAFELVADVSKKMSGVLDDLDECPAGTKRKAYRLTTPRRKSESTPADEFEPDEFDDTGLLGCGPLRLPVGEPAV